MDLRTRYVAALAAVALLSICGQILVQLALDRQFSDSRVINIAGRQRMFSQRICKAAMAMSMQSDARDAASYHQELKDVLQTWSRCHDGLQHGDAELGLPGGNSEAVTAMFGRIDSVFQTMHAAAARIADTTGTDPAVLKDAARTLLSQEQDFLKGMDTIVFQYSREAEERVRTLKRIELTLLGITILVLALEGLFVFRPAVQRIRSTLRQLLATEEQLEAQNVALQRAATEAKAATQAKSQFLANVSHEIRTPLNAVVGMSELLARTKLNEAQMELAHSVHLNSRTLLALLNDILDFSRIEAGKVTLSISEFNPRQTIQHCMNLFAAQAREKSLRLTCAMPGDLPDLVVGDALRLQQVLMNLIANAIKFTDRGSVELRVTCETIAQSGRVAMRCDVQDTGIGIPESARASLFQPFTQVNNSSTRRFGGTGLGLSICKELISLMGGEIGFESEIDKGSTFWFRIELPVCTNASALPQTATPGEAAIRPQTRILVVDDVEFNQRLIELQLQSLGLKCDKASTAGQFKTAVAERRYDLILMDCQMPDCDGYELTRWLRAQSFAGDVPVVALTAHAMSGDREKCLAAGMSDYLAKPIEIQALASVLQRWLGTTVPEITAVPANSQLVDDAIVARLKTLQASPGVSLLDELLPKYEEQNRDRLQRMDDAVSKGDWNAVARLAHDIKSSSGSMGAFSVANAAQDVEACVRDGQINSGADLVLKLHSAFAATQAWFEENAPSSRKAVPA